MSNVVLKSAANDIETNSGNQLTLFVDLQGVMTVIDYRGVYQPLSDYIVSSPSFSQVEYFDTRADFPATGSVDVIYVATDTDIPYDWNPVTNDYDVLSANVGIGGLGNPPFFPIFTAPNQLGNSRMAQGNAAIVINPGQQLLDGNTLFSIQRIAGQAQLDFVIGNPGFNQPCQIISDNSIDGFELISYGSLSLFGGTSNLGLTVAASGFVGISNSDPQVPLDVIGNRINLGILGHGLYLSNGNNTPDTIGLYDFNSDLPLITYNEVAQQFIFGQDGIVQDKSAATLYATQNFGVPTITLLKGYNVSNLPTPQIGMRAYVIDALAPTPYATVVGGGSVIIPVFYDGTNWICN